MSINSLFIEKKRPRHPSEMPGFCFGILTEIDFSLKSKSLKIN